jgi:ABC-type multidrug transport system fused ATPase/permease subunit
VEAAPVNAIERILSRRSLVRGHARAAAVWSLLAVLMLVALLFVLNLLLGIVVDRGRLELILAPKDIPRFEQLTRLNLPNVAAEPKEGDDNPPKSEELMRFVYDESGILPAVWQTRDVWWGGAVSFLFRKIGWLQSNVLGLAWLLAAGSLILLFRNFCLRQVRVCAHRIAIDAVSATRRNLHRQVLRLGPEDVDGTGHEIATSLFTVEVDLIRRRLYELVSTYVRFPLELVALAGVLLSLNWVLAFQWIAPCVLVLLWAEKVLEAAVHKQRLAEDRIRDEEQILLSSFQHARLTRGLGIEQSELDQFQKHLDWQVFARPTWSNTHSSKS